MTNAKIKQCIKLHSFATKAQLEMKPQRTQNLALPVFELLKKNKKTIQIIEQ